MMGKKHTAYSFETKPAAVRAVVDEGMTKPEAMAKFGIASPSSLKKWLKADLCQVFGHGSSRNYAAMRSPSSAFLVRSKNESIARAGTW